MASGMTVATATDLSAQPGTEAVATVTLAVPAMHCGGCMRKVEAALVALPGVASARTNLTSRRVAVSGPGVARAPERYIAALSAIGFEATVLADASPARDAAAIDIDLLKRVGVAGFAAANIMLLSVAVWSGHAGDMPASLQTAFHWLSAAIALPAVAYAGRPFFVSARQAIAGGRLNMDVPISLGVCLATLMSVYQTWRGTEQVYFDAAITLLFFLLIGRVLDQHVRSRARSAAENLLGLTSLTCTRVEADASTSSMPTSDVRAGMRVRVMMGERFPVDGIVQAGTSSADESMITGETLPRAIAPGGKVHAGTINLGAPVDVEVTASADNTLLAEIARLMASAEQARGRYVQLADRAARLYAPAVHALGAGTFLGWMALGHGWEPALTAAIAVLIITCPCALALAVPSVQVAATSRLFRHGVIVKAADGLERLADVDTIVLDKTGTLTRGVAQVTAAATAPERELGLAAALAAHSRHPYSVAVVAAARQRGLSVPAAEDVTEHPGQGLSGRIDGVMVRLGSAAFVGADAEIGFGSVLHLVGDDGTRHAFELADPLRKDAVDVVARFARQGYRTVLLSGDRADAVAQAAKTLAISEWRAGLSPTEKIAHVEALQRAGAKVLMIGDGLNDAPALAAGHASLSPATAVDVSQTASDGIFQGEALAPIIETLAVAKGAQRWSLQNFAIAIGYNIVFVPLAMAGIVTPLIAAIAMSASSLAVTVNAMRLSRARLEMTP